MPELPDLQVFSHNLNKVLKGKVVKQVKVPVAKKLNVSTAALRKRLEGKAIKRFFREGKELHIEFAGGNVLGLHLMLHGNLYRFDGANDHKHTILELHFKDGSGLSLTDWQKAATPTLNPEPREAPDALSKAVTVKFLKTALQRKVPIKTLLLDQKVLRGIGNAYADEILWDARLSPFAVSNKIPEKKIKALHSSIRKVLRDAEKYIRKHHPGIIAGEVRDFMSVHNSRKKESPTGHLILNKTLGGRKTYFTDEQENFE